MKNVLHIQKNLKEKLTLWELWFVGSLWMYSNGNSISREMMNWKWSSKIKGDKLVGYVCLSRFQTATENVSLVKNAAIGLRERVFLYKKSKCLYLFWISTTVHEYLTNVIS